MTKPRKATSAQQAEVDKAVREAKHPRLECPVDEQNGCPFCVTPPGDRTPEA